MKIKFRNNYYDSTIQDGNLILESIHETFIFPGLGEKLEDDCDADYWREGFKYTGRASFYSEWMDSCLQTYVDNHKEEAQQVLDLAKNLN